MLFPVILFITLLTMIHATFIYNEPKPKTGLVVRPYELPKISLATLTKPRYIIKQLPPILNEQPLKPNGDLCSCKTTVVSPAVVPKPAVGLRFDTNSKRLQAVVGTQLQQQQQQQQISASPPIQLQTTNYIPPPQPVLPSYPPSYTNYYNLDPVPVPTDPVSLQLALKAQRDAVKTLEDKLSFGFSSLPIDDSIKKKTTLNTAIAEENLLAMNGAVVALQPLKQILVGKNDDEGKQEIEVIAAGRKPTLGEVGFAPAYIVPPPTYTLPEQKTQPKAISAAIPLNSGAPGAPSLPCNEIYPGQVQTGTIPRRETYILPSPPLPPCNEDTASYNSYITSSSSSSQTSSNSVSSTINFKQNSNCGCHN